MINRDSLDQLAEQIGNLFGQSGPFGQGNPSGQGNIPEDIQRNIRALIQSGLAKMDVVTRDEFAAQTAVLERTRAKLDKLEKQLNELTKQLATSN